jgi:hypothetical protein
MRYLLILLAAAGVFAQPTVSNISTVDKTHSSIRLRFDVSSAPVAARVKWWKDGTTYDGGASYPDSGVQVFNGATQTQLVVRIGGLRPDTLYHFSPEVTSNGSTWSSTLDYEETIDPIPAGPHPAYPETPNPVTTARPDVSGYTSRTVASDCSDLQTKIDEAAANQHVNGSVITIPAGTVCTGTYTLTGPPTSQYKTYSPANVNVGLSRITITSHGFSDNDVVRVYSPIPIASASWSNQTGNRGLANGNKYYVRVVDANTISLASSPDGDPLPFTTSTFTVDTSGGATSTISVPIQWDVLLDGQAVQVVSTGTLPSPLSSGTTYYVVNRNQAARTMQLSATSGGAPISITTNGVGTHSIADPGTGGRLMKWPPTANWIIIRTATPDSEFVPEGVRVTPEFTSKMATFRHQNKVLRNLVSGPLAHHYRLEGIEFTHEDSATTDAATIFNVPYWTGYIEIGRDASNILIDRCYIHGLGFPNRLFRPIYLFNGEDSAIMNSYWDKIDFWFPNRVGMALTSTSGTELQLTSGNFYGPGQMTLGANVAITVSGTADGTGYVYYTMGGELTVLMPTGMSASCTGGSSCTSTTSASPTWPTSSGLTACYPIGTFTLSGGTITAASNTALVPTHTHLWEGSGPFLAGAVPEKTALINNTISVAGLVHYDDNVGNEAPVGYDYTIVRNHFIQPNETAFNHPSSNKRGVKNRQQLEWKNGKRIKIRGNIFQGVTSDVTPLASAIAVGPVSGRHLGLSDVEIGYNIFRWGSGAISVQAGVTKHGPPHNPANPPMERTWIHNNLIYRLNSYTWRAHEGSWMSVSPIDVRYAHVDVRIEHNTLFDNRLTYGGFINFGQQFLEGLSVTDNVVWANNGYNYAGGLPSAVVAFDDQCSYNLPACSGDGMALLNTLTFDYRWANNSIITGWTTEAGTTEKSKTPITNAFTSGTDVYSQAEADAAGIWANVAEDNFHPKPNSTHKSGGAKRASDGLDRGVDLVQLNREIGVITLGRDVLSITSSGATIPFVAPDAGSSCIVAYGEGTDPAAWTGRSSANTANTYARSITLSDLSANTDYGYRVWCSGTYQSETRRFITKP